MNASVLGTLSPSQFLRRHWQKKPLLVRAALPEIRTAFSRSDLHALACRDDVEARMVTCARGRWSVTHGPFTRAQLRRPPARHWSLLVQGVDLYLEPARRVLDRFAFVPYARQDDLMLSLAPPGGGVGPHFDSYDVFLIQVRGRRRWRIGAQSDLRLVGGAPLRILRDFSPEQEIDVDPGDLLYLPPRYAHDGIALSECITCSVGFRAPGRQELAGAFLQWLPETLALAGRYSDPDLAPQRHPARIAGPMVARMRAMLGSIRWNRDLVETFLGEYLTEPKPHVFFDSPRPPLAYGAFMRAARSRGVRLALKTRMLYRGRRVFVNGEAESVPALASIPMRRLADRRALTPWPRGSSWADRTLHAWYRAGYVELCP
ncbi:MAG: cupin domain-containing protein [Burkholderiales bacterium]|nr:cupin domain-containing protein [Burkholderiales bacterium]